MKGPDAKIVVFWMFSFKLAFSISSFTFNKRVFSCSSLSAIRVVSYTYLRLLIFLLTILIPACASSSLAFHMNGMESVRNYQIMKKLNVKDGVPPLRMLSTWQGILILFHNMAVKKSLLGNFLAVQWSGICTNTAGAQIWFLVKELRSHKLYDGQKIKKTLLIFHQPKFVGRQSDHKAITKNIPLQDIIYYPPR